MTKAPALWRLTARALAEGYRDGAFSPVHAVQDCLERIERCEPHLHAMACVDAPGALAAARASAERWRDRQPLGPLDGVPLTLKDNLHAAGLPTRWGSRLLSRAPRPLDELPVARCRQVGLVVLGKTSLPEFALQGFTMSALTGVTHNPWNTRLTPGGSSGGAATSVAAGYAPLAVATDGGGSIRRPAAYCGVVGFKPSAGLVPRADGLPDLFLGHEVVGGLARNVADLRLLLATLCARALDAACEPAARLLFLPRLGARPVDKRLIAATRRVATRLGEMGHLVTEDAGAEWAEQVHALWPRLSATGLAWMLDKADDWPDLFPRENLEALLPLCGDAARALYRDGHALSATALFELAEAMPRLRQALADVFDRNDFILTPATAALPWPADEPHPQRIDDMPVGPRADAVFTPFVNAAGLPAITLPCGTIDGLPVAFQLVGPRGSDARLLAMAQACEVLDPVLHAVGPGLLGLPGAGALARPALPLLPFSPAHPEGVP
ncbi:MULTISPECIES: amidase [unclassified Variovorax]|uniref:amidase n=1 Tax=unclassified Variovorax TaxID=663243 RepID=UPI003F484AE4